MNLQQLRCVQEVVRRKLNLTDAARALGLSQPGVSRAIIELEQELGVDIFERHGKRLRRITEPGAQALLHIDALLREATNLRRMGQEFGAQHSGTLHLGATHVLARHVLPAVLARLRMRYGAVRVCLHQGTRAQVAQMLRDEVAEVGLVCGAIDERADLLALPCQQWQHMLVTLPQHPLAQLPHLGLDDLARHALIACPESFAAQAPAQQALAGQVCIEAADADAVMACVQQGLGAGIVPEMAQPQPHLACRPLGHLLGSQVTRLVLRRGLYLRGFVYDFAELFSERLPRKLVQRAMSAASSTDHGL